MTMENLLDVLFADGAPKLRPYDLDGLAHLSRRWEGDPDAGRDVVRAIARITDRTAGCLFLAGGLEVVTLH